MSAIKMYSNDSLGIVMWDHRPWERFAPHDNICDILRADIKSRFYADMLSLRMWYSVNIYLTYRFLHTCNFFQMLMQINRSNWGHLQKGALCPMLLYRKLKTGKTMHFDVAKEGIQMVGPREDEVFDNPLRRPLLGNQKEEGILNKMLW